MGWPQLLALALCLATTGCAVAGSGVILNGRATYDETIVASNNEQILAMIVRLRYGEPPEMPTLASVTANVQAHAVAGVQIGAGADSRWTIPPARGRLGVTA